MNKLEAGDRLSGLSMDIEQNNLENFPSLVRRPGGF